MAGSKLLFQLCHFFVARFGFGQLKSSPGQKRTSLQFNLAQGSYLHIFFANSARHVEFAVEFFSWISLCTLCFLAAFVLANFFC